MNLILVALLFSSFLEASPLYFEASQLSGTEKMKNVEKAEFLFDESENEVRHCGFWEFRDGSKQKFEMIWSLDGSVVKKNGKPLGSYYDGNIMLEEVLDKSLSLEVSRFNETFFEYHFHQSDLGFVDGDGWLKATPSDGLKEACP